MTTPQQVLTDIRNQANEQSAAFWNNNELYSYMWTAEKKIVSLIGGIDSTDTSITSVSGTQEYTIPTTTRTIQKAEWDSVKLKKINVTRDLNSIDWVGYGGSQTTGNPTHYYQWGRNIGLWPIPTSAETLKLWTSENAAEITRSSTAFTVDLIFHDIIPDYCLFRMYMKDKDNENAAFHRNFWDQGLSSTMTEWKMTRDNDMNSVVVDQDFYEGDILGIV